MNRKNLPGVFIIVTMVFSLIPVLNAAGAQAVCTPRWRTQWSYIYGGDGHAQFAQPVMELDGDNVPEVIVGGYETTDIPGYCHILNYNKATGNYDNKWTWNSGGNAPSGACPLNLGNGTTLLIVSWVYGDAPGVYAYRWNRKNLTQVDYYPAYFVYDVYAADLLKNGKTEIVVSSSPGGDTPYTVFLLGWNKATQKLQFLSGWEDSSQYAAAMSWVGDIYGNGKNEIVSPLYDGVWALSWHGTANLSATQIYGNPFTIGYPFGVSIGYVRGDRIPEIGLGNINYTPVGAEACLLKYNTCTHVFDKVWDGQWPTEYCIIEGVAIGDVYNNGRNEFLAAGGNLHIIGWTGKGYAEIDRITKTQGMISGCNIGDFDGDGKNEVKCCDILGFGPGDEWIFKYS
jgi:hypothetical protein